MKRVDWNSLVVELPPHVHLGGVIAAPSTSGIYTWKRGLLQMGNINFYDMNWFRILTVNLCVELRNINMEREFTFELQPPVSYFIHNDWFLTVFNQIELIRTDSTTKRKPLSKAEIVMDEKL